MEVIKFPKGFLWGASTSSHQAEGGNSNDWTEWEKANAHQLARKAGNNWTKQQQEMFPEMFRPENYISGRACDHYNRFEKDFDIAKLLGHNAHRFSIEWSRVEPEEGNFNEKEIEHYRQVILALRKRGLEPFVTLWHWTNPLWLPNWASNKAVDRFIKYVEKIVSSLKNEVKFWITVNESELYSAGSQLTLLWPPAGRNFISYILTIENLIKAHKAAYKIIKSIQPEAQVGVATHNVYLEAYKNRLRNAFVKKIGDWWINFYFLDMIKNHQDFIGLNYYFYYPIKDFRIYQNKNEEISDLGWEIFPEGIYHVLKDLRKYEKPIYITENGLADAKDAKREKFIKNHLYWINRAIQENIDVRGYFYWSLLDNFEWDKGFWPRFGLIEVDYQTMERKIRPSAYFYQKICQTNSLMI
ncbi:MAG: glycoside hydrolase family 1 protein [bacterium]|nr:glycoside hydrolase family 1 protein [bacterium]